MRKALILVHGNPAAVLTEHPGQGFDVVYLPEYDGEPVSLSFPVCEARRRYSAFPAFLDNLLLEGAMLQGFLHRHKVDQDDNFSQLIMLGEDLVGALTVREMLPGKGISGDARNRQSAAVPLPGAEGEGDA
jgi:serine/threonine-protein kinase HipA